MTKQEVIEAIQKYVGLALARGRKDGVEDIDDPHENQDPDFRLFEIEACREYDDEGYPESNWEVIIRFPKDFLIWIDTTTVEVQIRNDLEEENPT